MAVMPARLRQAVSVAVLIIGFGLATFTRADADLWGHTRYGLDILRDHELAVIDPYSFTQDKPWVNHEWLTELQMGGAYRLGGAPALALLKAVLILGAFALAWRGLNAARLGARIVAMLVLMMGTIHVTSSIRPQVWSFLFLALLCRGLVSPRPGTAWWLPLLFAVWANCHGGWIVGFGVLGLWAAVDCLVGPDGSDRARRRRMWFAVVPASFVATLANPYGIGLWRFLAETVRPGRNISEWGPLWGTPFLNWVPWFVCVGGVIWVLRSDYPRRFGTAAVLTMLAFASARVMRVESLFVIAAVILLSPLVARRWPAASPTSRGVNAALITSVGIAMIAGALLAAGWMSAHALRCLPSIGGWAPDVGAVRMLGGARPGRLVTFFDWGQYALWHLSPTLRVSMDGRRETIYSDRRLDEHDAIIRGDDAGLRALDEWRADYLWLPSSSAKTRAWAEAHGYRIDMATDRSFVATRADLPTLASPQPVVDRPCFPN